MMHIHISLTLLTSVLLASAKPAPGQHEARQVAIPSLPTLLANSVPSVTLPTSALPIVYTATLVPSGSLIAVPPAASPVLASIIGGFSSLPVAVPPISSIIPGPASLLSAITGPINTLNPSLPTPTITVSELATVCAQAINLLQFIASLLEDVGTGFSVPSIPNTVFPISNSTITSLLGIVQGLITECTAINDLSSVL
ncbi:hypothetical protein JMJ35_007923 [Cladonia borealis]|uniref:Uncharacterized protein n=1 Tax=Cladonia borealis TaxID=184061 RepID=A0AA39QWC9_9LECA|nr:hypothetical protein JMJ35_007923 [Cladonia borealis]